MSLYLLKRKTTALPNECQAKVVRGIDVRRAREIANLHAGPEGEVWTNILKTSCERIFIHDIDREILSTFNKPSSEPIND